MSVPDHRDLVIRHLADAEGDELEALADVEAESASRLTLAQFVIQAFVEEKKTHATAREQLTRLRDEYRHLREQVMRQDGAS